MNSSPSCLMYMATLYVDSMKLRLFCADAPFFRRVNQRNLYHIPSPRGRPEKQEPYTQLRFDNRG